MLICALSVVNLNFISFHLSMLSFSLQMPQFTAPRYATSSSFLALVLFGGNLCGFYDLKFAFYKNSENSGHFSFFSRPNQIISHICVKCGKFHNLIEKKKIKDEMNLGCKFIVSKEKIPTFRAQYICTNQNSLHFGN